MAMLFGEYNFTGWFNTCTQRRGMKNRWGWAQSSHYYCHSQAVRYAIPNHIGKIAIYPLHSTSSWYCIYTILLYTAMSLSMLSKFMLLTNAKTNLLITNCSVFMRGKVSGWCHAQYTLVKHIPAMSIVGSNKIPVLIIFNIPNTTQDINYCTIKFWLLCICVHLNFISHTFMHGSKTSTIQINR